MLATKHRAVARRTSEIACGFGRDFVLTRNTVAFRVVAICMRRRWFTAKHARYTRSVDRQRHWEHVYRTKHADQVSWYRPHLDVSLELITRTVPDLGARIVDVGGGEATLVDDLVGAGYAHVDVLDLSETALEVARSRLGEEAKNVGWLCGDVTTFEFQARAYDLWHDRAVFHFLTDPALRRAYVQQVSKAVRPGGHVIVATFGPEGPTQCSGLDVVRYDAESLHAQFGDRFTLIEHQTEDHVTPAGRPQQFVYCLCRT